MISDFIYKYYIDPIRYGEAYTIVDTLTYALILIIAVYLVYRWLSRKQICIDGAFILATIPYVLLGGFLRVIEDTGMIQSDIHFLLITPLIFFVIFVITVLSLIIARWLETAGVVKTFLSPYWMLGAAYSAVAFCLLIWWGVTQTSFDVMVLLTILLMALITTAVTYAGLRYLLKWEYMENPLYTLLIFGHMIDASATSYGIDIHPVRYVEQHVVGGALIDWTGTAFAMYPLKLAVLIPGVYILEMYRRENGDTGLWYLILLAMIIVGMAPGIRGMMRMVLHV
ncbi:MAG: Uncharacterized protein XE11_0877 [Methanomicrobiales archaeon 53_19]|uniref:DUF63 family protein n=1 Tax=Methanocalculus sp. TaxID=2004547 RepID=UPI00074844A6|nr:DUF63 family protein [Methanocalculus sp.]KUK70821.1 MAG: Uncharacterized protein XD88_0398 [Methanocalculus sp. 52_23]KUL04016.1 MAG: Uncharacterized protein XE11_0877 [Methanomicrobiales archaeon 53_19]HIJ06759.1 DUF63 family protein [Methanocalculus sp.]